MDMDDIELPETELFVNFTHTFKIIRVIANRLIPTTLKLKTEVIYDELDLDEEYLVECQIALQKIRYWFDNCVANSVVFSRDNDWALQAFLNEEGKVSVQNRLVVLPDEPTDAELAEIFQSKMNALGGGNMEFGFVELTSDDANGLSFMFTGDGAFNLPDMEEWIGERTFFSKPWWNRDDASTLDVIPDEDEDLNKPPEWAYSLDFIGDPLRKKPSGSARIIRPEFRPQVIDGGKVDE